MLTRDPPTQVRKRTKCLVGQFSDFVSSGSKQARSSYQLDGQDARGQGGWLGGWGGTWLPASRLMRPALEGRAVGAPDSLWVPSSMCS